MIVAEYSLICDGCDACYVPVDPGYSVEEQRLSAREEEGWICQEENNDGVDVLVDYCPDCIVKQRDKSDESNTEDSAAFGDLSLLEIKDSLFWIRMLLSKSSTKKCAKQKDAIMRYNNNLRTVEKCLAHYVKIAEKFMDEPKNEKITTCEGCNVITKETDDDNLCPYCSAIGYTNERAVKADVAAMMNVIEQRLSKVIIDCNSL